MGGHGDGREEDRGHWDGGTSGGTGTRGGRDVRGHWDGGDIRGHWGGALGDVTGHRDGGNAAASTSHFLHIAVSDGSG